MKRRVTEYIAAFLVVYITIVTLMFSLQRKMLYFPPSPSTEDIEAGLKDYERFVVKTADGLDIAGYFIPPSNEKKPIILVFHGNASHPAWLSSYFRDMTREGFGILFAEYRGYGGNMGTPTEEGLYNDAAAYLKSDLLSKKFSNTPLIAYGQSLGSGVAVDLVSKNPERFTALVLEVPFASVVEVVRKKYWFVPFTQYLVKDQYNSDKKIDAIKIPKLFILAGRDEVIGYQTGRRLYELASGPKMLKEIAQAGHNDISGYGTAEITKGFIKQVLGAK